MERRRKARLYPPRFPDIEPLLPPAPYYCPPPPHVPTIPRTLTPVTLLWLPFATPNLITPSTHPLPLPPPLLHTPPPWILPTSPVPLCSPVHATPSPSPSTVTHPSTTQRTGAERWRGEGVLRWVQPTLTVCVWYLPMSQHAFGFWQSKSVWSSLKLSVQTCMHAVNKTWWKCAKWFHAEISMPSVSFTVVSLYQWLGIIHLPAICPPSPIMIHIKLFSIDRRNLI